MMGRKSREDQAAHRHEASGRRREEHKERIHHDGQGSLCRGNHERRRRFRKTPALRRRKLGKNREDRERNPVRHRKHVGHPPDELLRRSRRKNPEDSRKGGSEKPFGQGPSRVHPERSRSGRRKQTIRREERSERGEIPRSVPKLQGSFGRRSGQGQAPESESGRQGRDRTARKFENEVARDGSIRFGNVFLRF